MLGAAASLESKIDQLETETEKFQPLIPSKNVENIGKITNVVQMVDDKRLSNQIQAMMIAGKTDGLTDALSEVVSSEEEKQNIVDAVRATKEDIQNSIEKGADTGLYEEKMSLLLTGKSLVDDAAFFTDKNSFAADFDDIYSTFSNGIHQEAFNHDDDGSFSRIGEKISFAIPGVGHRTG